MGHLGGFDRFGKAQGQRAELGGGHGSFPFFGIRVRIAHYFVGRRGRCVGDTDLMISRFGPVNGMGERSRAASHQFHNGRIIQFVRILDDDVTDDLAVALEPPLRIGQAHAMQEEQADPARDTRRLRKSPPRPARKVRNR